MGRWPASRSVLTGREALGDWTTDAPGVRRKVTIDDLAKPFDTPSANNHPQARPAARRGDAPRAQGLSAFPNSRPACATRARSSPPPMATSSSPRACRAASSSCATTTATARPRPATTSPRDSIRPFGIAFYPPGPNPTHVYIGNTDSVVRFPYQNGDTKARGPAEVIVKSIPSGRERVGGGGHWTRDVEFSRDGKTLFVSVGSRSNVMSVTKTAKNAGPTSSPSTPMARTSESMRGAFATQSAWRSIRKPANCGARSTSATDWATIWSPITSPTSRKVASTAGPGIISAPIRTRGTRTSIPSSKTR